MGKRYSAENSIDKLCWDGLLLLVILNLLRIDFLLVKGKNFAGDDLQLQLAGDRPVRLLWG